MKPQVENNTTQEEGYRFLLPPRPNSQADWLSRKLARRAVVEITPEELRCQEHIGPLSSTKRWPLAKLRELRVVQSEAGAATTTYSLEFRGPGRQLVSLLEGYPQSKLQELADHLRRAATEWGSKAFGDSPVSPVSSTTAVRGTTQSDSHNEVQPRAADEDRTDVETSSSDAGEPGAIEPSNKRPSRVERDLFKEEEHSASESSIRYSETDEGILIRVPPRGLLRGSHGLVILGGLFALVGIIASVGLAHTALNGDPEAWVGVLIMQVFLLTGVAMFLGGWNMGTRRATLEIDGEGLHIQRNSIFGNKLEHFSPDHIDDVRVAPSGMKVNDRDVMELQIHARGRKALGMLSQFPVEDCERIAQVLSSYLTRTSASDGSPG